MAYPISDVPRRIVYSGSAGVGPYAFTFEVLTASDIAVYKNQTLLTLTTDYTVSINTGTGTGTVTLVVAATGADTVTLVGDRAIQRTSDFVTGGDLFANTLNAELDAQTIYAQQIDEKADRAIRAPVTDPTAINMVLPPQATRASKALGFNASGNPTQSSSTLAAIDAAVTTIQTIAAASPGSSAGISHIAAGPDAVATTVQAKLRELPAASDYSSLANALAANAGPVFISSNRLGGVQYATDRRDKKYRFLAGVIRQNTPGSGWYFLTTGAHNFAGFSGTLSISGSDLIINYGFTASNVVSLIAVPDETFTAGGLVVGASVGTSSAILSFYTPFDMRTSGTAIAVGNHLESGVDVTATFDIPNGTCAVTHPSISHVDSQGGFVSVQPLGLPDGNQYTGVANSVTKTGFTINYRHAIYGRVNGAAITTLNTGSSASWNGTDTLTITHPASGVAIGDVSLSPGDGTYIPICTASTATTITVQFRDYAGTLYTGASSPAIFYYLRGGMATSTISGAAKLHAQRGLVQARASYVASASGNIWLYGVMEEA